MYENVDFFSEEYKDGYYNSKKDFAKQHPLMFLFFEVTLRCNAHCEHCGSSCGDKMPDDEITKEEIIGVLDDVAYNSKYDPRNIMLNITGGEPLVRKDLFEIMKYAHYLGYNWGMVTNGILINEEIVDKMLDSGIYSVSVSLDGLEKTHESFRRVPGAFKKIINNIKLMHEKHIPMVQVITCVNKKNIDELEEIHKLMVELQIQDWRIIEVDPIGRAKDNKDLLLDKDDYDRLYNYIIKMKNTNDGINISYGCGHFLGKRYEGKVRENGNPFYCSAGITTGCILSNGDMYVCPDVARRPEFVQGNIRKDSFVDVWENKYQIFRNPERTCNDKCKKCKDWKLCQGDGFHTWDFDKNKPCFCVREIWKEDYKDEEPKKKTTKKAAEKKTKTTKKVAEKKKTTAKKTVKKKETKKTTKKKSVTKK